jgi:hypothetical protein
LGGVEQRERLKMKMQMQILRASVAISVCLMPAVIATAHAEVFYPRGACRIYVDTDFIRLPNQCGTAIPAYSRTTFAPHVRRLFRFYD